MKKLMALLALGTMMSLPAMAQVTPADTNHDTQAAQREVRSAHGDQLRDVSDQEAMANALKRCERLPDLNRRTCEDRIKGEGGKVSGSVIDGGLFRSSTVTIQPE